MLRNLTHDPQAKTQSQPAQRAGFYCVGCGHMVLYTKILPAHDFLDQCCGRRQVLHRIVPFFASQQDVSTTKFANEQRGSHPDCCRIGTSEPPEGQRKDSSSNENPTRFNRNRDYREQHGYAEFRILYFQRTTRE